MGGVDQMDKNIGGYRVGIRSKKWYWPLFVFCLMASLHNSWQLYRRRYPNKLDFLAFLKEIGETYMTRGAIPPARSAAAGRSKNRAPAVELRKLGRHYLARGTGQRRCGQCGRRSMYICSSCNIGMCIHCMRAFHESP